MSKIPGDTMQKYTIHSWPDFQERIRALEQDKPYAGVWLFRGALDTAEDSALETTLYRQMGNTRYKDYMQLVSRVVPELNAFSEHEWQIHLKETFHGRGDLVNVFFDAGNTGLCTLKTLIHLRHHGFPSPLLDWTRSPYIAAYFALNSFNSVEEREHAVIYCHIKPEKQHASCLAGQYQLYSIGNIVPGNKRHFLQQTEYTYVAKIAHNQCYFGAHREVSLNLKRKLQPMQSRKLYLPSSLWKEFMVELQRMNITEYTLFTSEDALVKALYQKIIAAD